MYIGEGGGEHGLLVSKGKKEKKTHIAYVRENLPGMKKGIKNRNVGGSTVMYL